MAVLAEFAAVFEFKIGRTPSYQGMIAGQVIPLPYTGDSLCQRCRSAPCPR